MTDGNSAGQFSSKIELGGEYLYVRPGRDRPRWVRHYAGTVTFTNAPGHAYDFKVTVGPVDGDRVGVTSLCVSQRPGGPSINARALQRERLGTVGRAAIRALSMEEDEAGAGQLMRMGKVAKNALDLAAAHSPVGPRSKADLEADLRKAAKAYKRAQKNGQPTTIAVASALRCKASTARKRIMQARRRGMLPPATSTRPTL